MASWSSYSVTDANASPLEDLFHVAHVSDAVRIIEDEGLRARPVYDESILNQTRMHVVWLSANTWHRGSIYGTTRFQFSWAKLVKGRKIYWVEAINKYSPHACRLLVTDRENVPSNLRSYDPSSSGGPIKKHNGHWTWNRNCTLEIMIEDDVELKDCHTLDFVDHHPDICRLRQGKCKEKHSTHSARAVISHLIGRNIHTVDKALTPDIGPSSGPSIHWIYTGLSSAWTVLARRVVYKGLVTKRSDIRSVVRSALLQLAHGRQNQARRLEHFQLARIQSGRSVLLHRSITSWIRLKRKRSNLATAV